MRALVIMVLVATLLGIVLYWAFRPSPQNPPLEANLTSTEQIVTQAMSEPLQETWQAPHLTANTYQSKFGSLPESLKDTRIPFDLRVDEQNQLIIAASLRRLFDYFFTLVGEEDISLIKQRIVEILERHLPEPARTQASTIFQEYVALKEAEIALREQLAADYQASGRQLDLQERVRLMRELRQSLLSPEVYDAFYAAEDQRAEYSLQRHEILRDSTLSLTERNNALRELDRQLPESLREAKEEEYVHKELSQQIEQARAGGASDAEVFQLRSQVYGQEAAARFAEADKQQAEWNGRVAVYRQQRREVMQSGLSGADQAAEIERLREQHFSGPELMRIPVIDRMLDEQGKP